MLTYCLIYTFRCCLLLQHHSSAIHKYYKMSQYILTLSQNDTTFKLILTALLVTLTSQCDSLNKSSFLLMFFMKEIVLSNLSVILTEMIPLSTLSD